jgi:hypothetical protein
MRLIGFSTSLTWGAPGHYLPVHSALNNEFKKLDPNSIYIGGDLTNGNEVWWLPWAPQTLRTRPNYVSIKKMNELVKEIGNEEGLLIDYEGRVSHIFFLSYVSRFTNTSILLNFHYTSELSNFTNSKAGALIFNLTIKLGTWMSGDKMIFTTESDQLSSEIERKIGKKFLAFPAFSVLAEPNPLEKADWKIEDFNWIVCRIKDHSVESDSLERMIMNNSESSFLIHGLSESLKKRYSKFDNVKFQELYVGINEYRKSLFTCLRVILIYDTRLYRNHSSGRLLDCLMFGKNVIVIDGMPIPREAVKSELVDTFKLNEIDEVKLRNLEIVNEIKTIFLPDARWAMNRLAGMNIPRPSRPEKRIMFLPVFMLFWSFSLLARAHSSLLYRLKSAINFGDSE